jgi:peptidyl-prolyl cis-trans isomerase A (cyclophilin A)
MSKRAVVASLIVLAGCSSSSGSATTTAAAGGAGGASTTTSSTTETTTTTTTSSTTSAGGAGGGASTGGAGGAPGPCGPDGAAPDEVIGGGPDPAKGKFSLDEALADLPDGPGPLRAVIETDLGTLTCTLRPDKAPNGVANFVGLARGRRPWKDPKTTKWVKRKFYDGLTFHRVIPDFMAQGGDPLGTGYGGPGYKFADEITDLKHIAGALAYANAGPDTNGSQFYVTDSAQPSLDGGYTVFGACEPVEVVVKLTHVDRDANDKPTTPLLMKTVTITRCAP